MKHSLITLICLIGLITGLSLTSSRADTYEAKYNTAQWLPVVLYDGTDGITLETGVTYAAVTVWYKEGIAGTWTQHTLSATDCVTPTSGDWCEDSTTNAPGFYRFYVPATVVDTKGKLFYLVKGTGYKTYWGELSIKTDTSDEESDDLNAVLADTGTDGVVLANDAITATKIAADAIGASEIAASAITSSEAPNLDATVSSRASASALTTHDGKLDIVAANLDERENTKCDISAATSSSSFTIASCTDHNGNTITLATDSFVGYYLKAYTNGGSQCNVVGQAVFASDVTSGGVATVKTSDMVGSDFSAIPNTTNCGVIIIP